MPIECQGTSPLKFVALSLHLYSEHAFRQSPQSHKDIIRILVKVRRLF